MSGFRTDADSLVNTFKTCGTDMKTYEELEREAYIAGNTELAKLYAEINDLESEYLSYKYERKEDE